MRREFAAACSYTRACRVSVSHFKFNPGDTLTLISDGVLEAQSKSGQLFGFDRVRDLLRTRISAAEVARAAQEFGQEDDISFVSVTRSI